VTNPLGGADELELNDAVNVVEALGVADTGVSLGMIDTSELVDAAGVATLAGVEVEELPDATGALLEAAAVEPFGVVDSAEETALLGVADVAELAGVVEAAKTCGVTGITELEVIGSLATLDVEEVPTELLEAVSLIVIAVAVA